MRAVSNMALNLVLGMFAKSRLILIFVVFTVIALIWVDRHTRGLFG